jgi:hypothetical protein
MKTPLGGRRFPYTLLGRYPKCIRNLAHLQKKEWKEHRSISKFVAP